MSKKIFLVICFLITGILFEVVFYFIADEIKLSLFLTLSLLLYFFLFLSQKLFIPKTFFLIYTLVIISYIISGLNAGLNFQISMEITKLFCYLLLVIFLTSISYADNKIFLFQFIPIAIVTAFLSLIGILEFTSRAASQKILPLIEPFHWPNLTASFLLLTAPITFVIFLEEKRYFKKIILFISLILMIVAWILTKTYILILLVIFLILSLSHFHILVKNRNFSLLKINARNIALIILLLLVLLPNLFSSFGGKSLPAEINLYLNQLFFYDKAGISGFALQSILNHFWTGIGPGNFAPVYQANLVKPWTWSDFAQSEPLQILIETGFLGFAVYLLFTVYSVTISIKRLIVSVKTKNLLEESISLTIISFIFLSFTNSSLRIFPIAIVFYFLLAFLFSHPAKHLGSAKLILILLIALLLFSFTILSDGLLLNLGQRFFAAKNYPVSEAIFSWIIRRPESLLNPKVRVWLATLKVEQGKSNEALEYLSKAKDASYYNPDIDYQIAYLRYNRGEIDKAEKILEENILSYPYSPPKYYLALSKIEAEKNKPALEAYWLKRASLIYPILGSQKILSHLALSLLDSQDYLNPLRSIYFSLYQLTNDKQYLTSFAELIY